MAWSSAAVTGAVARTALNMLHARTLMLDGSRPAVRVRPQTWWLLLDLAGTPPLVSSAPRWRRARAARLAAQLSLVAQEQYQTAGWAGFWDQWLIRELDQRCEDPEERAPEAARELVRGLPWIYPAATDAPAVDPEWRRQAPAWMAPAPPIMRRMDV